MSMTDKVFKNLLSSLLGQIIALVLTILVPRLFIINYGSELNGFLQFVIQIIAYFSLIEAGLGIATLQALYRPFLDNERQSINTILSTSCYYYKRSAGIYLVCVLLFAFICPYVVKTTIDKSFISIVVVLYGLPGVINLYFVNVYKQALIADGKNYILVNIATFATIMSSLVKIFLVGNGFSVIYVQTGFIIIMLFQALYIRKFFYKQLSWVCFNMKPDKNILKEKSAILYHQISGMIFMGTNIAILTVFTTLNDVSIFATYNLIVLAIYTFLTNINSGLQFVIGQGINSERRKFEKIFNSYNILVITLVYAITSIVYFLLNPFIFLYTNGADINYVDRYLPILFCIIQLLDANRLISTSLIVAGGHMQKTLSRSIIEACLNLVLSFILVNYYGIYGVLWGTILALIYRSNDIIVYSSKYILRRRVLISFLPVIVNTVIFILAVILGSNIKFKVIDFFDLAVIAICCSFFFFALYLIINALVFRSEFKYLHSIFKSRLSVLAT